MPSSSQQRQIAIKRVAELRKKLAAGFGAAPLRDGVATVLNNLWRGVAVYPPATEANRPGRISIRHTTRNLKATPDHPERAFLQQSTAKPMGYYERGRGWWYPVVNKATLGDKRGKGQGSINAPKWAQASRAVGYKLSKGGTSQTMGRQWYMNMSVQPYRVSGTIGNGATYSNYVQGNMQAKYHKARGWKTIYQVFDEQLIDNTAIINDAITAYLKA